MLLADIGEMPPFAAPSTARRHKFIRPKTLRSIPVSPGLPR